MSMDSHLTTHLNVYNILSSFVTRKCSYIFSKLNLHASEENMLILTTHPFLYPKAQCFTYCDPSFTVTGYLQRIYFDLQNNINQKISMLPSTVWSTYFDVVLHFHCNKFSRFEFTYIILIIVFVPAYFFPFSKKQWNKHSKFVKAENWTQLHLQRIDITFDWFHVQNKRPRNKQVENKKNKLKNIF